MTEQKAERRAVDEVGGHPRSVAPGERTQYKLKPSPSTRARVRRAYQNTEHNGQCRMATETAQCVAAQLDSADTAHSTAL